MQEGDVGGIVIMSLCMGFWMSIFSFAFFCSSFFSTNDIEFDDQSLTLITKRNRWNRRTFKCEIPYRRIAMIRFHRHTWEAIEENGTSHRLPSSPDFKMKLLKTSEKIQRYFAEQFNQEVPLRIPLSIRKDLMRDSEDHQSEDNQESLIKIWWKSKNSSTFIGIGMLILLSAGFLHGLIIERQFYTGLLPIISVLLIYYVFEFSIVSTMRTRGEERAYFSPQIQSKNLYDRSMIIIARWDTFDEIVGKLNWHKIGIYDPGVRKNRNLTKDDCIRLVSDRYWRG